MKRLLVLVVAVLVPFAALVVWGLSRLDAPVATPQAAAAPGSPAQAGQVAREGLTRALQPQAETPTPGTAPGADSTLARGNALPPAPLAPAVLGKLEPSPLDAQAAEVAARPRPLSALGKDPGTVLVPPPRVRQAPQVLESVMKNGFPPRALAAAQALTAQCWADNQARAPGPVQVTVLARPTAEGRFDQTRVSWSSWSDPIFMACVEDAISEGTFPTGDRLPPAPVIHTLEFGAAH